MINYNNIKQTLHRKIITLFKNINLYIIIFKTIFKKLKIDLITRNYKLLYKNS